MKPRKPARTLRHTGAIDIIGHPRVARADALRRAAGIAGLTLEGGQRHRIRTNVGQFHPPETGDPEFHVYADSMPGVSDIVVLADFPNLYDNDFTHAWLGCLLADTGGGTLWIEIRDAAANRRLNKITADSLARRFPSAALEAAGTVVRMSPGAGLDREIAGIPSIYPRFHNGFGDFVDAAAAAMNIAGAPSEAELGNIERTYKYSLFGANQKQFVTEAVLRAARGPGPRRGLDVGGGYGFLAAEMAAHGDTVDVIDYDRKKIESLGPWIARRCGLGERMAFRTGRIEDVPDFGGEAVYDYISYFGCLLYADRDALPAVLRASMRLLRPGGVLIVHENTQEGGKPGTLDYEKRFPADALRALLLDHAGEPTCYSMFTANPVPWEHAAKGVVMAAIRKDRRSDG